MLERKVDLVLIPGINNTSDLWSPVTAALPDWVNCIPVDCAPLGTVRQIAEQLLADLPEIFCLLGFSFGGYVALEMISLAPERINGLILVNTNATDDSEIQLRARRQAAITAEQGGYEELSASLSDKVFHPTSLTNPVIMAERKRMTAAYGAERYIAHQYASMDRADHRKLLASLQLPVLVIGATDDQIMKEKDQMRMAESVPQCTYESVRDAGHMLPMEKPNTIANHIENWMTSIYLAVSAE
tara:strand:+ start:114 stop:842 length:729 start_codon:yes stop_codon:yes gene_type:complete